MLRSPDYAVMLNRQTNCPKIYTFNAVGIIPMQIIMFTNVKHINIRESTRFIFTATYMSTLAQANQLGQLMKDESLIQHNHKLMAELKQLNNKQTLVLKNHLDSSCSLDSLNKQLLGRDLLGWRSRDQHVHLLNCCNKTGQVLKRTLPKNQTKLSKGFNKRKERQTAGRKQGTVDLEEGGTSKRECVRDGSCEDGRRRWV